MSATNPTIIFVHGAWHDTDTWSKVTPLLEAKGFACVAVSLPSTAGDPTTTFRQDIDAVREAILAETTQGKKVLLVLHSYGGAVGQSAIKGLDGIIGLFLITCGFPATGVSMIEQMGGKPPPSWRSDESGFATLVAPARESFYHDLPLAEGEFWVSKLKKQCQKVLFDGGEDSYAGWMEVPVWFLAATDDQILPFEVQKMFIAGAKAAGAAIEVREIGSSHSPMLSKPQETVDFIVEAVTSLTRV